MACKLIYYIDIFKNKLKILNIIKKLKIFIFLKKINTYKTFLKNIIYKNYNIIFSLYFYINYIKD